MADTIEPLKVVANTWTDVYAGTGITVGTVTTTDVSAPY